MSYLKGLSGRAIIDCTHPAALTDIMDHLIKRNKRVRLTLGKFQGIDKVTIYVAGRDLHEFRREISEVVPMGLFVDVRRLKSYQCRFKKIQLPGVK